MAQANVSGTIIIDIPDINTCLHFHVYLATQPTQSWLVLTLPLPVLGAA